MARARTLKPSFFMNDRLAEIPPLGRLLFQGLWCIADREGRLEDRPRKIKAELLPYDSADVEKLLDALHAAGFIIRYEAEGKRLIQVVNFTKHQNPHVKEAESTLPAPCEHSASTVLAPEIPAPAGPITLSPFPITHSFDAAGKPAAARERATQPTDAHRKLAAERGIDCNAEWEKYGDWQKASGKRHKDVEAGFRNWLKNAKPPPPATAAQGRAQVANFIFRRGGHGTSDESSERDITGEATRVA